MEKSDIVILLVTVGFFVLAYAVLMPVYRFLQREEEAARRMDRERRRPGTGERISGDGDRPARNGDR